MEENAKNEELEKIMEEVSRNFSDKPHLHELSKIMEREGKKLSDTGEEVLICRFYTEGDKKYVQFYGEYKEKARSMKELEPLIKYLDGKGYSWR
jgi:hypothetical protein